MIKRLYARSKQRAAYLYYVWEGGEYVQLHGGEFENDQAAINECIRISGGLPVMERPATLEPPHIHVIREDAVHILTLELPHAA